MFFSIARRLTLATFLATAGAVTVPVMVPQMAQAQTTTGFKQALAAAVADNKSVAAFYKANGYESIFVGKKDRGRRAALLKALRTADTHGLPAARYRMQELEAAFKAARSQKDRGRVEGMAAKIFVQFARDLQSGALEPRRVDSGIVRVIPRRDAGAMLATYAQKSPASFMKSLAPRTPEYARLMKEKMKLEKIVGKGGWGAKVQAGSVKPGQSGEAVVQLRNRLIAMGYSKRTSSPAYDANLQKAVQLFQFDHGLVADGVAGETTIKEVNTSAQKRLSQVIVAMERERWMEGARGDRHVLVNIPDFSAKIMDKGKVTFQTRTVVGANTADRRTPEFSDTMEHMVINPTWNVPRSIATKEYLPLFKKNRNAAGHLQLYDNRGRKVSRANINFASYTARTFPYAIKQPPSRRNALGLVKFMFPNKHNIYLHDTPAKNLFGRDVRAFSHGCVRLNDPFDFAYALLAKQQKDPVGFFQGRLKTGSENVVPLQTQVPVHIIYRTAFTQPKGRINYRRDIYGRDAKLWNALQKAGVTLRAAKG